MQRGFPFWYDCIVDISDIERLKKLVTVDYHEYMTNEHKINNRTHKKAKPKTAADCSR